MYTTITQTSAQVLTLPGTEKINQDKIDIDSVHTIGAPNAHSSLHLDLATIHPLNGCRTIYHISCQNQTTGLPVLDTRACTLVKCPAVIDVQYMRVEKLICDVHNT